MFEVPSQKNIKSVKVTKEVLTKNKKVEITYLTEKEIAEKEDKKIISVVPQKERKGTA